MNLLFFVQCLNFIHDSAEGKENRNDVIKNLLKMESDKKLLSDFTQDEGKGRITLYHWNAKGLYYYTCFCASSTYDYQQIHAPGFDKSIMKQGKDMRSVYDFDYETF